MTYSFVISTCKNKNEAKKIAQNILKDKLVACVNLIPIDSFYLWKGKIVNDKEIMLILKTKNKNVDEIMSRIEQSHSYSTPEIIQLKIEKGNEAYLKWIEEVTK